MVGRRGQDLSLDRIIQLVIVGILVAVTFALVAQNGDSSGFFQEYYTYDMHLLSELVSASPGDLTVSYDNIREDLGLTYRFGPSVSVGSLARGRSVGLHEGLTAVPREFESPYFLTWSKTASVLDVRVVSNTGESCKRVCSVDEVGISIEYFNMSVVQEADEFITAASIPLLSGGLPFSDDPNVKFVIADVLVRAEPEVLITYSGDLPDAEYVACLLQSQLADRTGFAVRVQSGGRGDVTEIRLEVARPDTVVLSNQVLGEVIGRTVAIYR